ncbi:MAG: prepilin peptidase [Patescibacteria group bacterium]
MTEWGWILLLGLGLFFGSFINVLIVRYDPNDPKNGSLFSFQKLRGRSHCPACGRTLGPLELIPVFSFIVQGARCRGCKARISFQYPLVEILTGCIFAFVPFFLNGFWKIPNAVFLGGASPLWYYGLVVSWVLVFLIWLVMAAVDLKHYIIPNELSWGLGILGVLIAFLVGTHTDFLFAFSHSFLGHYAMLFPQVLNVMVNRLLAAGIAGLLFYALYAFSSGRAMGFGDVKLALAAGILFGWPDITVVIALSFMVGGLVGLYCMVQKKKTMKDMLPFAPFFVAGSALTVFGGVPIVQFYFSVFGG